MTKNPNPYIILTFINMPVNLRKILVSMNAVFKNYGREGV